MKKRAFLLALAWALPASGEVSLQLGQRDGQPVYVIETEYLRSEIAHTRGRSPLTYYDKISGTEQLRQLDPLDRNHGQHYPHGGVAEAMPWTGGSPYMGYLWTQPWEMTARTRDDRVVLTAEMTFPFPDPVTGRMSELRFKKRMTAFKGSTRLRMDYRVENVGERRARFQHCVHGSPCVGGSCDEGDYFFAPGDRSWVVWSGLLPELEIPDQSWHPWPIPGAIDFAPTEAAGGLQLFVPAPWAVVGDDKAQLALAMVGSQVVVGDGRQIPMYMGYTRGKDTYYLEPSLTKHISNHADRWEREGYSVDLERGEACVYTVDMAMFHGVSKAQVQSAHTLVGDYLLLSEPRVEHGSKRATVRIDGIAVSGDAQLIVADASSARPLWTTSLAPGKVHRIDERVAVSGDGRVVVSLQSPEQTHVLGGGSGQ